MITSRQYTELVGTVPGVSVTFKCKIEGCEHYYFRPNVYSLPEVEAVIAHLKDKHNG